MKPLFREIFQKLSLATRTDYLRNVITLVSGTTIAQLIPFLLAPVLSRIYTPDDFGLLALYLSIAQILGVIACGRYESAILLPKSHKSAVRVTQLSIGICICMSVFILVLILLFRNHVAHFLGDIRLSKWLYLLPLSTLFIGVFNALTNYQTKSKSFGNIAKANATRSFGSGFVQLVFGLLGTLKFGGLILGQVVSHTFGFLFLQKNFFWGNQIIDKSSFYDLLKRYQNFPKYSIAGSFLNATSQTLPNLMISRIYALSDVGFYSHAYKYLGLPINLIGSSISQVFNQKMAENRDNLNERRAIFMNSAFGLIGIGLIIFIPVFFVIEDLYVLIFGQQWVCSATVAKSLTPLFFIRFVAGSLHHVTSIFERQNISLIINLVLLSTVIVSFGISYFQELSFINSISLLSTLMLIAYSFSLVVYYLIVIKGCLKK